MKLRRGVSEILASMIVLLIVSSLGVMLFNISASTLSGQQSSLLSAIDTQKRVAQERFEIVTASRFTISGRSYLNVTFYNYGQVDVNITDIYLENLAGVIIPIPYLEFRESQYLTEHRGVLLQSDFSYIIIPDIPNLKSVKIVSAEGVKNEIIF